MTTGLKIDAAGALSAIELPDADPIREVYLELEASSLRSVYLCADVNLWLDHAAEQNGKPKNAKLTRLVRNFGCVMDVFGEGIFLGTNTNEDDVDLDDWDRHHIVASHSSLDMAPITH